ncbi:hypothetical protein [Prevotella nigrescens]|uniref:hypothetical protein n=1 Tax=Prevotella nigrescens TaxID=28133 RepID=UPI0011C04BAB|nr:hypothetical protein [Prevotella nigrescens]UAK28426.1 hypothetical protein K8O81_08745 [Prevotella nigrescens]WMS22471.1 hypothetical protein RDV52_04710 [Prevotella nigrescens]
MRTLKVGRQLSQRGYGNHRYGVTAIVATGLRQSSLRGYDNRRNGVTANAVTEQVDMAALQRRKQRCSDDWEKPDSWLL